MKRRCVPLVLAVLATFLGSTAMAAPAEDEPPAGVTLDVSRTITLLRQPPRPCLTWSHDGVSVVLPLDDLQALVTARPSRWRSEEQRRARIEGNAAERLLQSVTSGADRLGCRVLPPSLDGDGERLVLQRIRRGRAALVETAGNRVLTQVRVRYLGDRCGPACGHGEILVHLPGRDRPWLVMSWWRS